MRLSSSTVRYVVTRLFGCSILTVVALVSLTTKADTSTTRPVLISESNSTRGIAFEAVMFTREPFAATSPRLLYGLDNRTRVIMFARNLTLQPGDGPSIITADAEDGAHCHYTLKVEYVGKLAGQEWISQLTMRLNDSLGDVGDVLVGITYRGVASNRVRIGVGHIGGGPPDDQPLDVLDYDGSVQNVDYGPFWSESTDLGRFFWEFWAMPGENAYSSYLLSDGYGGAHALLFGFFAANDPRRYSLYGNIYTGSSITAFNSDDGPAPGEWGHFAVGWDGRYIITYYNGVPVGRTPFAGPRRTPGPAEGGGRLYIGGSDHNNLIGRIAQVRGYEGINTIEEVLGTQRATSAFAPDTFFGLRGNNGGPSATFLTNFFYPARSTPNLAGGTAGVLRGGTDIFFPSPPPPLSRFVIDPAAPSAPTFGSPNVLVDDPKPAPSGARIFDSFSRRSATLAFDGGGLGSTEGGSDGPQVWRVTGPNDSLYGPTIFGILNGRAVTLSGGPGIAWVSAGSTTGNLDVRVDRHAGQAGSGVQTGLCFRVKDGSNFFFVYTGDSESDPFNDRTLNFGYFQNGDKITLARGVELPDDWTTLRAVTSNTGRIDIYVDDAAIYEVWMGSLKDEKGAGLYNDLQGLALTNRWDNFMVWDASVEPAGN